MREGPREYRGDFPVPLGSGQFVNLVGRIGRLDPKGVALSFVNDNVKRLLWVPEEIIKPTGSTLHLQLFSVPYPRDQKKKERGKADTDDLVAGANNLWTLPENMVKVILKNGFSYHFE